jgi:hypothetical protein
MSVHREGGCKRRSAENIVRRKGQQFGAQSLIKRSFYPLLGATAVHMGGIWPARMVWRGSRGYIQLVGQNDNHETLQVN